MIPFPSWFFFKRRASSIPAGRRAIDAVAHRRTATLDAGRTADLVATSRTAALERGRVAELDGHRRTAEVIA